MCRRVKCTACDKPTYSGCGMHVEQVLGDVPREERCACRDKPRSKGQEAPSILRRLFGL